MTLKKRFTDGTGNPMWYCEACGKTYANQAQAITHLVRGHGMGKPGAECLLADLKATHGIIARAATR